MNSPAQGQGDNNDPTSEETQPEEYYQSIYQLPSGMTPQFEPDTVVAVQDLPGEDDLTNSVESSQYPDRASSTLVCCDEVKYHLILQSYIDYEFGITHL